ncbi:1-aminocyclopropane-1-carboxylate oxidase-like 1 [Spatholobus suberectus]|nr:1-aminocyclopropane-1-carboxylate oxidase-like 1 [Spatholobus suberectus]
MAIETEVSMAQVDLKNNDTVNTWIDYDGNTKGFSGHGSRYLASIHEDPSERKRVVERVKEASETWGFFQIVHHGIPVSTLKEMMDGVLRFHEQDSEIRKEFYTRDLRPFFYNSNYNLYTTAATTWKDSFFCNLVPNAPKPEDLPAVCRDILLEYSNQVLKLGTLLFELLSEALGLDPTYLTNIGCTEGLFAFSHYYPACPEPELTMGTQKHADVDFITVLLQDHIGGLQVLHQDMWIDLPPVPGTLVVNVGDFLQLISNDKFKSAQHRVLANPIGPRVSIACFLAQVFIQLQGFMVPSRNFYLKTILQNTEKFPFQILLLTTEQNV